ncbi:MAG TPA: IS630 family transposase, partial [Saprospiraceae bacterium]|nr:IS630 family transposase [Saprospiraceae bacterium]
MQWKFADFYLYGAVAPLTGESFFLELPYLNRVCFQTFLTAFSKRYRASLTILQLDNASPHLAQNLRSFPKKILPC